MFDVREEGDKSCNLKHWQFITSEYDFLGRHLGCLRRNSGKIASKMNSIIHSCTLRKLVACIPLNLCRHINVLAFCKELVRQMRSQFTKHGCLKAVSLQKGF